MSTDELLIIVASCAIPALGIGVLWWLARRYASDTCPACDNLTLVRQKSIRSWQPLVAIYVCRNCGNECLKFRLRRR